MKALRVAMAMAIAAPTLAAGSANATVAIGTQLVVDGFFQQGLANWTATSDWSSQGGEGFIAGVGSDCASTACLTGPTSLIYQDIATETGATYTFEYYYGPQTRGGVNGLHAAFGTTKFTHDDLPYLTFFRSNNVAVTATGATTRVAFSAYRGSQFHFLLDAITVTKAANAPDPAPGGSPAPEPATWAMLILGFGLTGAAMRRRRGFAAA